VEEAGGDGMGNVCTDRKGKGNGKGKARDVGEGGYGTERIARQECIRV
jgi:hypothetical protein